MLRAGRDLQSYVMCMLPARDVLSLSETCKNLLKVSRSNSVWNALLKRDYELDSGGLKTYIMETRFRDTLELCDGSEQVAMCEAAGYDFDLVKYMISRGIKPTASVLSCALTANQDEIAKYLIANDPRTEFGRGICTNALWYGSPELVKFVLDDPRSCTVDLLQEARDVESVKLLLAHPRVGVTSGVQDALLFAIRDHKYDIAKAILADPRICK